MTDTREIAEMNSTYTVHPADAIDEHRRAVADAIAQEREYIGTATAADMLCVSRRTVENMVKAGTLHAWRPTGGRKMLLLADEVRAYADEHRAIMRADAVANAAFMTRRRRAWERALVAARAQGRADALAVAD